GAAEGRGARDRGPPDGAAAPLPADAARARLVAVDDDRLSRARRSDPALHRALGRRRPRQQLGALREAVRDESAAERRYVCSTADGFSRNLRAASIAAPRFRPLSFACLMSITVSRASMS